VYRNKSMIVLLALLVIDLISKYVALATLPMYSRGIVSISRNLGLAVALDATWIKGSNGKDITLGFVMVGLAVIIMISLMIIYISKNRTDLKKCIFAFLVIACGIWVIMDLLLPLLRDIDVNNHYLKNIIEAALGLIIPMTILVVSKNEYHKICWAVLVAGGIGNALNYLLPPYAAINFIVINPKFNFGFIRNGTTITNLADFFLEIGSIIIVAFWILTLVKKIYDRMILMRTKLTNG